MNPFVGHLIDGLTFINALVFVLALGIVLLAWVPVRTPDRPEVHRPRPAPRFLYLGDPPTGSIPVQPSEIVIDTEARAQRRLRAGAAQVRREEGLRRQLALAQAREAEAHNLALDITAQLDARQVAARQLAGIPDEQSGGDR